jgi:hypothetical protein
VGSLTRIARYWALPFSLFPTLPLTSCNNDRTVPASAYEILIGVSVVLLFALVVTLVYLVRQAQQIAEMERVLGREIHRYSRKVLQGVRR